MAEFTAFRNNTGYGPLYGLPFVIGVPLLDADGDPVSPSSPDSEISKNGDTAADCTNELVEISGITGGCYLSLTGTELTCDMAYLECASTGAKTTHITLFPRKLVTIRAGTSASGGASTSTVVLDGSASTVDDFYNGMIVAVVIDSVTEVRVISDYTGSTQTATVVPDWNTAPDNNDTFTIYLPVGVQLQQANTTHIAGSAVSTSTAQIGVNVVNFGGSAGTFSSGRPEVNASHISGSSTAADNVEVVFVTDFATNYNTTIDMWNVNVENWNTTAVPAEHTAGYPIVTVKDGTGTGEINTNAGAIALVDLVTTTTTATNVTTVNGLAANVITAAATHSDFGTEIGTAVWATTTRILTAGTNIDGSTFTAIPWNASWDAEVQSEVQDALEANNLDHLVAVAVDTNFATTVHANSVIGHLADNGAGFDRTTDSLEALRDRGDAAWTTATGFSTHSASDVWAVGTRTLTTLDEDSTTLDLDATIRAAVGLASANLDTQLDALPTAAENATATWAAGTRSLTILDEDSTTLDLDATIRGAVGMASANLDTQLATIDTVVDAILADTGTDGVVLSSSTMNSIATALLDLSAGVETSYTLRQALRLILSSVAGELSGAATSTITIRDVGDTKNRMVVTCDSNGNRSAITYDVS